MSSHRIRLLAVLLLAGFTGLVHAQGLREEIVSRDFQGVPTFVRGGLGTLARGERGAAAVQLLREVTGRTFTGTGTEDFVIVRQQEDELGQVHIRAQQRLRGLPVVGGVLIVPADAKTGEGYLVNGNFAPDRGLPRAPSVAAGTALESALREAGIGSWEVLDKPSLTYVIGPDDAACLAWAALVSYIGEEGLEIDRVFADATDGSLVVRHPQIHRAKDRKTYTSDYTTDLPGWLLISEGGSSSYPIAQTAHDHTGTVYDYYLSRHGRDSLNGSGMTIKSSVDALTPTGSPNNAFWTGTQAAYGPGDGNKFGPFGNGLDMVAHELTHGVTDHTSDLNGWGEPGALDEAMSDIFGAAAETWARGGVINSNTWKIGEDVYTPNTAGDALRYMNNPTQDKVSRDYYPSRYTGGVDNGGVHWNSGIANLAFYLLVQGGQHPRGVTPGVVTGIGMLKAERIFYRAQTVMLAPNSDFEEMRASTAQAARDLYGPAEVASVHAAWCAVGVPGCPDYDGVHEAATCRAISGWALDWLEEGETTAVDVYDGSTRRATVPANRCRPDVGCHGFSYVPSTAFKDGRYHTVYVRHASTNLDLVQTPRTLICNVSVFTNQKPAEFPDATGGPWSVGNDVTVSTAGIITHLRYYKALGEDGPHVLKLWPIGGGPALAEKTVDFGSGQPAGWVTADITNVPVAANTTYRVSVTTYTKQSKTACGLSSPVTNGPLKATGGAWSQGDGVFPSTGSCSNYWTDVIFDQ